MAITTYGPKTWNNGETISKESMDNISAALYNVTNAFSTGQLPLGSNIKIRPVNTSTEAGIKFENCEFIDLYKVISETDEEIAQDEVIITMRQFKELLAMLEYYKSIVPFTPSQISSLRNLIDQSQSGGTEPGPGYQEPPADPDE